MRYVYLTPRIALLGWDDGVKPLPFQCELARAAQIVSMKKREKGRMVKVHKDMGGRKYLQPEGRYGVPTVIGGRTPPVRPSALTRAEGDVQPSALSNSLGQETPPRGRPRHRREFGLRAFKTGKDILLGGGAYARHASLEPV